MQLYFTVSQPVIRTALPFTILVEHKIERTRRHSKYVESKMNPRLCHVLLINSIATKLLEIAPTNSNILLSVMLLAKSRDSKMVDWSDAKK
jgi:hypothetical protein